MKNIWKILIAAIILLVIYIGVSLIAWLIMWHELTSTINY